MTNWQKREAARIGNTAAIETADDTAAQERARLIRAENIKRTAEAAARRAL